MQSPPPEPGTTLCTAYLFTCMNGKRIMVITLLTESIIHRSEAALPLPEKVRFEVHFKK